jgi:E3 SUMO-protein ligase PIAS1
VWDGRSTNDRNIDLPLEVPAHLLMVGSNRIFFTANDPEPHVLVAEILVRQSAEQLQREVLSKRTLSTHVARAHARASFDRMGLGAGMGADDDDGIEASSVQLTLQCPLTRMRIGIPARGVGCSHIECFDLDAFMQACAQRGAGAASFLNSLGCALPESAACLTARRVLTARTRAQVQSVARNPKWLCPMCSTCCKPDKLRVCSWLRDILARAPADASCVLVDPQCNFTLPPEPSQSQGSGRKRSRGESASPDSEAPVGGNEDNPICLD